MKDINNMMRCEMEAEIETLRARVVELEEGNRELTRLLNAEVGGGTFMGEPALKAGQEQVRREAFHAGYAARNDELAALKAGQGEPVAWYSHCLDPENIHAERHGRLCMYSSKSPDNYDYPIIFKESDLFEWRPLYTQAPTVQEGWQLVPIEPTSNMNSSGYMKNLELGGGKRNPADTYKAMLSTSPQPTKAGE